MFRCFTPKENIIRIWERISLFPHVRSSEVMVTQPQPPSLAGSSALDLTFSPPAFRNTHIYTHTDTHTHAAQNIHFVIWILKMHLHECKLFWNGLSFLTVPSGLSLLQQLSDLTQPDNRVGPKWNQKQFVLVWAIIPFPISHASPFSPLSPSLYLLPRIKRHDFRHSYKKQLLSNFPLRNILKDHSRFTYLIPNHKLHAF